MHNNFIVVDGDTVKTGGFNFTAAAEAEHAENIIVLHDSAVAQRYGRERLLAESEPIAPRY
jgi:phosphatidylserine/phosphatidylglycerophosphate/cardiolipin synthase-like enzyme